jgi:hypothetical protein
MPTLPREKRHIPPFPPPVSTGRADGAFYQGANRSAIILFKGAARLALMYRKLSEVKLRPGIERFSQIKGLRQLPVSGETYSVE